VLNDIIRQEQDREIHLKGALGLQ